FRSSFFFFQAEDGIRDLYVTGVQTCALPISPKGETGQDGRYTRMILDVSKSTDLNRLAPGAGAGPERDQQLKALYDVLTNAKQRSEERRVGKECRCRWGTDP